MKKELYVTQKPKQYKWGTDYSWCDTIFMVVTDDAGNQELYMRDEIGTWEKVTEKLTLEYFKVSEPINITNYLSEKYPRGLKMQKFQRTKAIESISYGQIDDRSFCYNPVAVIAQLPNGALLELSNFLFEQTSNISRYPVKVISSRYTKDGNYILEDLGIPFGTAASIYYGLRNEADNIVEKPSGNEHVSE